MALTLSACISRLFFYIVVKKAQWKNYERSEHARVGEKLQLMGFVNTRDRAIGSFLIPSFHDIISMGTYFCLNRRTYPIRLPWRLIITSSEHLELSKRKDAGLHCMDSQAVVGWSLLYLCNWLHYFRATSREASSLGSRNVEPDMYMTSKMGGKSNECYDSHSESVSSKPTCLSDRAVVTPSRLPLRISSFFANFSLHCWHSLYLSAS